MNENVLLKIFTEKKAYDFYPSIFDKKKLSIGSAIDNDIWVPEIHHERFLISVVKDGYIIDEIDDNELTIRNVGEISRTNPYTRLNDDGIRLVAIFLNDEQAIEFYSLIDINEDASQTIRVGEVTIGADPTSENFISQIDRITSPLNKGHICAVNKELPLISSQHACIYYNDFGEYWIKDIHATNGLYVNEFLLKATDGKPAQAKLSYGDVIDLFTIKIVFCESYLQIHVLNGAVSISGLDKTNPIRFSADDNAPILKLPPRKTPPLPSDPISLPSPPGTNKNNRDITSMISYMTRPLLYLIGPLAGSALPRENPIFNTIRIALYIIGPLMMVLQFARQRKQTKAENKKRFNKFRKSLSKRIQRIDEYKRIQSERFSKTHSSAQDNLRRAVSMDWRLWERTTDKPDFMQFRLGVGVALPSFEITKPDENSLEDKPDELVSELETAFNRNRFINHYPITLDFKENPNIGLVGTYISRLKCALASIIQLSIHHAAEDLKIVLFIPEEQKKDFEPLRFLPHLWKEDHSGRLIFTGDNRISSCDGNCSDDKNQEDKATCPECYRRDSMDALLLEIEQREKILADSEGKNDSFLPGYLFVIADINLVKGENTHDLCSYFLRNSAHLGIHTMCLGEQRTDIPPSFSVLITTGYDKGNIDNNEGQVDRFHLDLYPTQDIDRIARALAPIRIENLALEKSIPSNVSLLDLFSAKKLEDLDLVENWKTQYYEPIPETPVGKIDQKKLLTLNITKNGIGPHGIIGGTTGSGKSEFLLSVILGMAVKCHPHRLGMVILDYKGGSTAEACKNLPHVHGIVTDLDQGVMTKRALAAIRYEVEYRENIFRKYSNSTGQRIEELKTYIKIIKDGPIIPYMLVIVDELAELKIREPAAMDILEDIARRGRSVGIYLLLTTQNPQGVINNQIQANVNYKICFRISKDNSRGIIDSPEAAYISDKTPGRGLLRVGNNELIAFQSAYTGAPYKPAIKEDKTEDIPSIYEVDIEGQRHPFYISAKSEKAEKQQSQLNAVVDKVIEVAEKGRLSALDDLWLDPLPERIILEFIMGEPNFDGKKWRDDDRMDLRVTVGLSDDIRNREYFPTQIDFEEEKSHLVILGPSYSGKTTLLQTMMISLAMQNSPKMLNMYMFDFSPAPNLSVEKLPHMGNVFVGANIEDIITGRDMLTDELNRRSSLFSKAGVSNFREYNAQSKSGQRLPSIVVFVDNIDEMGEMKSGIVSEFENLIRNGIAYGMYFSVTAPDKRSIPYEFRRYFDTHSCCLWPEEVAGYDLPRGFSMTNRSQGRGIYKDYEFQSALPVNTEPDESVSLKLTEKIESMAKAGGKYNVLKSTATVDSFSMPDLAKEASEKSDSRIPIGFDVNNRTIAYYDLLQNNKLIVSYINKEAGREKLVLLYNRMYQQSSIIKNKKVTVLTRDDAWVKAFEGYKNMDIQVFDKEDQKLIDDIIVGLAKEMNKGETNRLIICDEWGELIYTSTEETYAVMRLMFTKDVNRNVNFILGGSAKNIAFWSQKGCPHILKPINEAAVLADGQIKQHTWFMMGTGDEAVIEADYCVYIESHKRNKIRLK